MIADNGKVWYWYMLNHVNWVQQEQNTEYHVIQWKNSEFHNHHVKKDREPGGMGPFSVAKVVGGSVGQAQVDGLGYGEASQDSSLGIVGNGDRAGSGSVTADSQGREGTLTEGVKGNDGVNLSSEGLQRQQAVISEEQPVIPIQNPDKPEPVSGEKENSEPVSGLEQGNIRNRLKDSAKRLQEIYQRQKDKLAAAPAKKVRPEEKRKTQRGTRMASREEMLAMQAENHYLLDSYDKKGQYSILGK